MMKILGVESVRMIDLDIAYSHVNRLHHHAITRCQNSDSSALRYTNDGVAILAADAMSDDYTSLDNIRQAFRKSTYTENYNDAEELIDCGYIRVCPLNDDDAAIIIGICDVENRLQEAIVRIQVEIAHG
jgi:hypothetical protein